MTAGARPDSVNSGSRYASTGDESQNGQPITLLTLVNAILRQRRLILAITLLAALVALVKALTSRQQFVATASFSPSSTSATSSINGLAAQFGMDISNDVSSQSPAFYADLLRSRPLLQPIVQNRYTVTLDGRQTQRTLIDIWGITGQSSSVRVERAVRALRSAMQVTTSLKTGVVTFTVTTESPVLTSQIAQSVLSAVNDFNVNSRRTQASSERRFTEQRVDEIRGELSVAEARLLDFLQANRNVAGDPALQLTQNRLTREVERLQGLYDSLSQSLEHAKIDEVRDTPAITIIEHPEQSVLPAARNRLRKVVLAAIFGFVAGLVLAFIRDIMARDRLTNDLESAEFDRLRNDVKRDFLLRPRHSASG